MYWLMSCCCLVNSSTLLSLLPPSSTLYPCCWLPSGCTPQGGSLMICSGDKALEVVTQRVGDMPNPLARFCRLKLNTKSFNMYMTLQKSEGQRNSLSGLLIIDQQYYRCHTTYTIDTVSSPSLQARLKNDEFECCWRRARLFYNNNQSIRMGLWPWAFFSQIFTPKFWKSLKADGLIQTYQRGHKAVMNTHTVGGNSERTRYVGMDQYGNKYYEDFDYLYRNQRRWVEYNDYLSVRSPNGDMIPPKWHGWLSHQYDEVPTPESPSFYDPFFEKPHEWNYSYSPFKQYTSRMSNANARALEYAQYRNDRYAREWEPTTKRA